MEEIKKLNYAKSRLTVISAKVCTLLHIIFGLIFALGSAEYYGKSINIFSVVEFVLAPANYDSFNYYIAGSMAVGITYAIFLISVIKNIIVNLKGLNPKAPITEIDYILFISNEILRSTCRIALLSVIVRLITQSTLTSNVKYIISIGLSIYFLSRLHIYMLKHESLDKKEKIKSTLINLAFLAIPTASIICILSSSWQASIENVMMSISQFGMFRGTPRSFGSFFWPIISNITKDISYLVITFCCFRYLSKLYDFLGLNDDFVKTGKTILKCGIIIQAISIISLVFSSSKVTLNAILDLINPIMFPIIALYIASQISMHNAKTKTISDNS